jgi:hypothetical protein
MRTGQSHTFRVAGEFISIEFAAFMRRQPEIGQPGKNSPAGI